MAERHHSQEAPISLPPPLPRNIRLPSEPCPRSPPAEQAEGGGVEGAGRGIEKEKESTLSLGSRVENEISKTDETDCAGGRWWWFYRRRAGGPVLEMCEE